MGTAIQEIFDPTQVRLDLVHVTWLTGIVSSPIGPEGIDDPVASDLLLYEGAVEALIDTPSQLREAGFQVSTHLREDRDPARPLAKFAQQTDPTIITLGLGKHGAGIGRRLLPQVDVPLLYVNGR